MARLLATGNDFVDERAPVSSNPPQTARQPIRILKHIAIAALSRSLCHQLVGRSINYQSFYLFVDYGLRTARHNCGVRDAHTARHGGVLAQCEARLPSLQTLEKVMDTATGGCRAVLCVHLFIRPESNSRTKRRLIAVFHN